MPESNQNTGDEKTESPTQFRREEFRRQGHVALSKEIQSVALLCAMGGSLYFIAGFLSQELSKVLEHSLIFGTITPMGKGELVALTQFLGKSFAWMMAPVALVSIGVGMFVAICQVGFHVTFEPLAPNWGRLNPINGIQRLFSWHGTVEAVKAVIKLTVVLGVLWYFIKGQAPALGNFYGKDVTELTILTLTTVSRLFFVLLATLAVLAVADYAFQRFQLEKQMRMTRREAKEEFKLREGDPLIKSRIRSLQRRMASRRMMEQVPKADAIVTNPTHLAVALKYDAKLMAAPKVVAKGAGFIAEKIKEIARFHQIPIVENKPLARTLYKKIEINHFIPRELYKAVAEVLAYVYRLRGLTQAAGRS